MKSNKWFISACIFTATHLAVAQDESFAKQTKKNDSTFKHVYPSLYIRVASGFIATDPKSNNGLVTTNFEYGGKVNYYFKKKYLNDSDKKFIKENGGTPLASPISVYASVGWGPFLIADKTIPNYWYFNSGLSVSKFSSNLSYGLIGAVNSTEVGSKYLYGITASLDGIPTPFFFSYLKGDSSFSYLLLAGFHIPLSHLNPFSK